MTLHQLKVFATVAKFRSFTLAGETLRVRQPSVSLLVKGLEQELEVKLFEKLGNKVHLTTVGEALLHDVEAILAKVEGIKEKMDEIRGLRRGKISVGSSGVPAATFLPELVQKFKKEHSGVDVTLQVQSSNDLERKLLTGDLDVAILGRAPQSSLVVGEPYGDMQIVAIAPPNHPLTRKRFVPLELIAKEPLIATKKGNSIRNVLEQRFSEMGLPFEVTLEVDVHAGIRDAVKSAVASGLGIGFVSKSSVMLDIKTGRLKILKIPEKLKRTMYIAVHKNRQSSSLVQSFIDFLRHYNKR